MSIRQHLTTTPRALFALTLWITPAAPALAGHLYWSDDAGVHRVNAADGSDPRHYPFLAQNLIVHDGKLFSIFEDQISVSDLDGANHQPAPGAPPSVQDVLRNVARDPQGNVYSGSDDQHHLVRANPGGESQTIATTGHRFSPPMTVQFEPLQSKVYWMGGWNDGVAGLLERADPDGSNVQTLIGPELLVLEDYTAHFSLDVAGGWVYWADASHHRIRRAPLRIVTDGDDVQDLVLNTDVVWAVAAAPTPEPAAVMLLVPAIAFARARRRRLHV